MNKSESKYFNTALKMDASFLEILEKKDMSYITVKEICERAGVNRSTFYLHYETMGDLLSECVEYINEQFLDYMKQNKNTVAFVENIRSCSVDELYLITPQYLTPYLNYIKEHRRLFHTAIKNPETLNLEGSYDKMFQFVFTPILERYQVPFNNRRYIMAFYIKGLMAIITEWIESDCQDDIDYIITIIQNCVVRRQGNTEEL